MDFQYDIKFVLSRSRNWASKHTHRGKEQFSEFRKSKYSSAIRTSTFSRFFRGSSEYTKVTKWSYDLWPSRLDLSNGTFMLLEQIILHSTQQSLQQVMIQWLWFSYTTSQNVCTCLISFIIIVNVMLFHILE